MLTWLFLRKANFQRIESILKKENFIYESSHIEILLKGNQKGTRYGNIVLSRKEGTGESKRFLKLVLDGKWRTFKLFRRQVEVTRALFNDKNYNFHKLKVLSFSLKAPVPYAVFETREEGENFGFMHDIPKYYERFTAADAHNLAKVIYGFHVAGHQIDPETFKHTQIISSKCKDYIKELNGYLNKKVIHKFTDGSTSEQTIEKLLEKYTGLSDLRERILNLFNRKWWYVTNSISKQNTYFVHADMALDNVYQHADGSFEPLDFEWVGTTNNQVIPIMFDFGNLRARAWSSPAFQNLIDQAMAEEGRQYYDEELVEAALKLGKLRSGLMMCRYHMDFPHTTRNDKRSEEDYMAMQKSTVATIEKLLKD